MAIRTFLFTCRAPRAGLTSLALLCFSGLSCSRGTEGKGPRARPAPLVAIAKVVAHDVDVTVQAPIDLRPLQVAEVGSKTLGYLDAVLVDRGDVVRRGQLLATVRPSDLPDQLQAERAALAQIQANAALARSNLARAKQLAPSGLVSQQELQQSQSSLASTEAAEAASKARIEALAVRLGELRIFSPLDGVVIARRLDPGVLVGSPGGAASIVAVAQTNTLRAFISLNERDALKVAIGQHARLSFDALPGRSFEGKLVRLSPTFDTSTRTLDVEVQLPNPSGELRAGMYGHAAIVLETHRAAPVVPATAVVVNALGRHAFVHRGGKVVRRAVETGVDQGEWLEVTRGLSAGDEVVVAGTDALSDGLAVRVSHVPSPASEPRANAAAPESLETTSDTPSPTAARR